MLTAACITFALGLAVFGSILRRLTPREERWLVAGCLAATLPMSWAMFHGVRLPLDGWLKSTLGEGEMLRWLRTAYAPLTEEPAKLWPLALPWVRKAIRRENVARIALALGLGFGGKSTARLPISRCKAPCIPKSWRDDWSLSAGSLADIQINNQRRA